MIEVNLLPGGKKGSSGGFSFSMPDLKSLFSGGGGGGTDPYTGFFAAAAAITIGYLAWSFMGVRGDAEDLAVRLEEQRQDSIRFATIIQQTDELQARGDSIARRVQIIQQIDADRFDWPHVLDEVGAAVPDFTWLREVIQQGDDPLQVRVTGRAGSIFLITSFMRRLEASRFLSAVVMENTQQIPSDANPDDLVYLFELVMDYESPPIDELESTPLFGETSAQTANPANPGN